MKDSRHAFLQSITLAWKHAMVRELFSWVQSNFLLSVRVCLYMCLSVRAPVCMCACIHVCENNFPGFEIILFGFRTKFLRIIFWRLRIYFPGINFLGITFLGITFLRIHFPRTFHLKNQKLEVIIFFQDLSLRC